MRLRLPHPLVLLLGGVALAALLTWIIPPGEYARVLDAATGRQLAVAGSYRAVEAAPVGPFGALLAVPRGLGAGVEVIVSILLVGGAWVVVDRLGVLGRAVGTIAGRGEGRLSLVVLALFFVTMGALGNMQDEIIPMVPALLVLGRRVGVDALTMVALSAGSAMIGSAFGPSNPYQAGIALTIAQLPLLEGAALRLAMLAVGTLLWLWWTLRHAARHPVPREVAADTGTAMSGRDMLILACAVVPMLAYVVGVLRLGWGFNELSAVFFVGAMLAGAFGRLGLQGTVTTYIEGMQLMLPASLLVGVARSISVVLEDGRVIDTILHGLATPLATLPPSVAALLMIPVHALVHIPVPSVSGQAALTMPIFAPLADLLGLTRNAAVLAYQTGAGLAELWIPTNGVLLAILLAAGVSYAKWLRFVIGAYALLLAVGAAGVVLG
jgi:uncharacterized ion transporter superfamily protein YfcC